MTSKLNKEQVDRLDSFKNKSTKIRYLDSLGLTRGQIVKALPGTLYQHVRNVLITPVKNPAETF